MLNVLKCKNTNGQETHERRLIVRVFIMFSHFRLLQLLFIVANVVQKLTAELRSCLTKCHVDCVLKCPEAHVTTLRMGTRPSVNLLSTRLWIVLRKHYTGVIMSAMMSQITSVLIVCWNGCPGADQRKHQSFASLAFGRGIHQWSVDCSHKWPVARGIFSFDDIIMETHCYHFMQHISQLMITIWWRDW